ncbi:MAG TPA: hypothetical protein VK638_17000 [Edaphobacter sp.]|nr:hypothetical protein [Edaphobacter sp.]
MKKNITGKESRKGRAKGAEGPLTIGLDLGDKTSRYCVLEGQGEVKQESRVVTSKKEMAETFGARRRSRIALGGRDALTVGEPFAEQFAT